jgi:hypothetical protein
MKKGVGRFLIEIVFFCVGCVISAGDGFIFTALVSVDPLEAILGGFGNSQWCDKSLLTMTNDGN